MTVPNNAGKYHERSLLTAHAFLQQRRQVGTAPTWPAPQTLVLCFQPALLVAATRKLGGKRVDGFLGETYLLRKTGGRLAITGNFGVGAPVTAVLLEDYAAYGVRRFVSIGVAGCLHPSLSPGDLFLPTEAIRDEGTSHHYLPSARRISAPGTLTARLGQQLSAAGHRFANGLTWTTDAPYRETALEVASYREEGAQTVEMEAAAIFAVATCLDVEAAAALVIGDTLLDDRWQLAYDRRRVQAGLEALLQAVVALPPL